MLLIRFVIVVYVQSRKFSVTEFSIHLKNLSTQVARMQRANTFDENNNKLGSIQNRQTNARISLFISMILNSNIIERNKNSTIQLILLFNQF